MNSFFRLLSFAALLLVSGQAFSQQDIIVQPNSGSRGERLQVLFSGVNVNFNQGSSTLYFTQGSGVTIFPEVFHVQASDVATGIYEIPVGANCGNYALQGGGYYFSNKFTVDCSAQIAGFVYFDANGNGNRDGNESGVEGVKVLLQPASGNPLVAFTDASGNYSALAALGNYTVTVQLPQYHQLSSTTSSYNVSLTSGNNVAGGINFGINYDGVHNDLDVALASTMPIAGFAASYWVNCHNAGTASQVASLTVTLDSNLTFNFASVPPSLTSGNTLTWNNLALQPGENLNITVDVTVAVVFPNTVLTTNANIASAATDETPANNLDTLVQNVLSSYDPNDKLVEPAGVSAENWTLKNQFLTYTIRFQNTGNFHAFNVSITDVLDQNLDLSTLQIVSSSHEVEYALKNREITFFFNNIMLPDSNTDLLGSNGYVQYRIKPKAGLADNVVIANNADIYFDFNPAVRTNTTLNKLVDVIPTGIFEPGFDEGFVTIYPNPAAGREITIELDNAIKLNSVEFISIYAQDGRELYRTNVVKERRLILTELADYHGVAIIRVQCASRAYYGKAVKL